MRHAKTLTRFAGCLVAGAFFACSSLDADSLSAERGPDESGTSSSSGGASSGKGGDAAPSAPFGSPAATGVVIAHSALFPSLRLCFQNYPDLPPQPDSKVMPGANVVGVEIGGAVRINPLPLPPGQVYVLDETQTDVRKQSGITDPPTCGDLITEINVTGKPKAPLKALSDYYLATKVDEALGVDNVDVLVISGCGDRGTIDALDGLGIGKGNVASCGTWDGTIGNLEAKRVQLSYTSTGPTDTEIPVQLFKLSTAVEKLGGNAIVKFGPQSGDAGVTTTLGAEATALQVDQTSEQSYGLFGFEVTATIKGTTVVTKQTLAEVQQLSSPGDLPTTYYRAASSYALLMLGDPSHVAEKSDGGVNPNYNPRRALHILAVPVLDPAKLADAGAPDAAPDGSPVIIK